MDFLGVYKIIYQEDVKNTKELSKPSFSVMIQGLLNLMKEKGLFREQKAPVIFLTEENIEDFIRDSSTNFPEKKVKIDELLRSILDSPDLIAMIEENLSMFENSQTWANENHKILSVREPHETPLNVKKKGTKR